jgi:hypothetical protein
VNEAYDTLSDAQERTQYDLKTFGRSIFAKDQNISTDPTKVTGAQNDRYKRMTSADVDRLMANANSFDRLSTAEYHARRSTRAPIQVGRRSTAFAERKISRGKAVPLPTKGATIGWFVVPVLAMVVWGVSINSMMVGANGDNKKKSTK